MGRGRGVSDMVRSAASAVAEVVRRTATAVRSVGDGSAVPDQTPQLLALGNAGQPGASSWALVVGPGAQTMEEPRDAADSRPPELVQRLRAILDGPVDMCAASEFESAGARATFGENNANDAEEEMEEEVEAECEAAPAWTQAAWEMPQSEAEEGLPFQTPREGWDAPSQDMVLDRRAQAITRQEVYGSLQNMYHEVVEAEGRLHREVETLQRTVLAQHGRVEALESVRDSDRLGLLIRDLDALQTHVSAAMQETKAGVQEEVERRRSAIREVERQLAELRRRVEAAEFSVELAGNASSSSGVLPSKLADALGAHGGRLQTIENQVLPDLAMRLAEGSQLGQELRNRVAALETSRRTDHGLVHELQTKVNEMQCMMEEFHKDQEKKRDDFVQQTTSRMKEMEKYIITQISKMENDVFRRVEQEVMAKVEHQMMSKVEQQMMAKMEQQVIAKMEPEIQNLVDHVKALSIQPTTSTTEPAAMVVPPLALPSLPSQTAVATGSVSSSIPKIDRSKKRGGGGAGLGGLNVPTTQIRSVGAAESSAAINQVRVAPVQAAHPMYNALPQALVGHLLGAEPGRFSGERPDWPEWRWQWQQYHDLVIDTVPGITSRQCLSLLRHYLDPATADELDAELIKNPLLDFEDFWVKIDLEFGGDSGESKRAQWTSLRLRHDGSLKWKDWRTFSQKFFKFMRMVPDAQEDEASRLMWACIPIEWRTRILGEAEKKSGDKNLVLEGLPPTLTEAQVADFVTAETGTRPTLVRKVPHPTTGKYHIHPVDTAHRHGLMKLDRQPLEGGGQLAVRLLEKKLPAREMDELMTRWLRVNETAKVQDHPSDKRKEERPRFQREVQAAESTGDDEWMEHQVAQVAERPNPTSAEVHPKKGDAAGKGQQSGSRGSWGEARQGKGGQGDAGGQQYWTPSAEPQWWYWGPASSLPENESGKGKGYSDGKGSGKGGGKKGSADGGKAKGKGGRGKPGEQAAGGGH